MGGRVLGPAAAAAVAVVIAVSGLGLGTGVAAAAVPDGPTVGMRVTCTTSGELCGPAFAVTFSATVATVSVRLVNQSACAPVKVHVALDGKPAGITRPLDFAGGQHGFVANEIVQFSKAKGRHVASFQAEGIRAGCDQGTVSSWEAAATFPTTVTINVTSDHSAAFVGQGVSSQARVSMSDVTARFATLPASASQFDLDAIRHPVLTRTFPSIDFNPTNDIQVACSNHIGIDVNTRPITDVIPQPDGTCKTIPAVGNGHQMGAGSDEAFEIAFLGELHVSHSGNASLTFFSDDGVILGIGRGPGGQPTRVEGVFNNPPLEERTAVRRLAVVGANNQITPPTEEDFKVHFPGREDLLRGFRRVGRQYREGTR